MENESEGHKQWTLLDLPVYTLRILLSFLDATALYNLSQTCTYLRDCIEDPSFWKYIDARSIPNTSLKLLYCTEKIHEKTSHIFLTSKPGNGKIPLYFFYKIKPFSNLRILSLEYQKLSGYGVTLKQFPACLEELSLKGTILKMRDSVSFFQHSSTNMEELKVLILDNCTWLTCSFLISVAKYKNLEIISVVNCPRIHLHTVPYLNVAKYGLKKLKVFDCRFTGIGAELLHTFYSKESIQKFYFQSFNCAQVDYKMNFPTNSKLQLPSESYVDLQISDFSLSQYHRLTIGSGTYEEICDSILYEDPYPNCTCGHKEYHEDGPVLDCEISEEDIPISHVTRFICEKHLKDMKNLPDTFRDFCVSSQRDPTQVFEIEESSDDDDFACCTIGTTSKMVILQNINDPSRRQEIVIPGNSSKFSGRQMNIFIVNPLGDRDNALALENENPLENLQNPLAHLGDQNPLIHLANWGNENRHNENRENDEVVRQNERPQNPAENETRENLCRENMTNENRDNDSKQHVRDDSHNEESNKNNTNVEKNTEMEINENNENTINEISQNQFMESLNLPGTSRGILENCMNENTENSRIEVERLQSESEAKSDEEGSRMYCQTKRNCDNKNNDKDKTKKDTDQITETKEPNNVLVIERSLFTSTSSSSSNSPSCSGLASNKTYNYTTTSHKSSDDKNTVQDDSRRHCRKRRNDCDKDNSSSDDDSNKTLKRHVKVILLDKQMKNPTSDSSTSNSNIRIQIPLERKDNVQPSTSGCHRKSAEGQASEDGINTNSHLEGRTERDADAPRLGSRSDTGHERARVLEVPEIHRDASGNPFRVFRINRTIGNAENARRINIRHMFPNEVPLDVRFRYRFPANQHKVSLRCLSLRGYKRITDTTLHYLKHLTLELLDLTYTSVTKEGIENFLLENPNCRIIHQNYCRCKPKNPF